MIIEALDGAFVIDDSIVEESEEEIEHQVREFVGGERTSFDLAFSFPGGGVGYVLRQINKIPYGKTWTYGELAEELDTSPRAVGYYCGENPLPLIIPCHRVVGKNDIGGYKSGKEVKQKLLELEQN